MSQTNPSVQPATSQHAIPEGFRELTRAERNALDNDRSVLVFDKQSGRITRWDLAAYNGAWEFWRCVQVSNGEVVDSMRLYDDGACDPTSCLAVVPISDEDLAPLLRASIYPLEAQDVLAEVQEARRELRIVR